MKIHKRSLMEHFFLLHIVFFFLETFSLLKYIQIKESMRVGR